MVNCQSVANPVPNKGQVVDCQCVRKDAVPKEHSKIRQQCNGESDFNDRVRRPPDGSPHSGNDDDPPQRTEERASVVAGEGEKPNPGKNVVVVVHLDEGRENGNSHDQAHADRNCRLGFPFGDEDISPSWIRSRVLHVGDRGMMSGVFRSGLVSIVVSVLGWLGDS